MTWTQRLRRLWEPAAELLHGGQLLAEGVLSGVRPLRTDADSLMGVTVPADFPASEHVRLNDRVGLHQPTQPAIYSEYAGGWNGVVYRFCECAQNDEAFRTWFSRGGHSPIPDNRYRQETHLFFFFVAGLAALESFSYMAHALGALVDLGQFPMTTADEKRGVNPRKTAERFGSSVYKAELLAVRLNAVVSSTEFKDWSEIRNVLAHRVSPPRHFYLGGPQDGTADWMHLGALGPAVTQDRRRWLKDQLAELVPAAADFALAHL